MTSTHQRCILDLLTARRLRDEQHEATLPQCVGYVLCMRKCSLIEWQGHIYERQTERERGSECWFSPVTNLFSLAILSTLPGKDLRFCFLPVYQVPTRTRLHHLRLAVIAQQHAAPYPYPAPPRRMRFYGDGNLSPSPPSKQAQAQAFK
jgi:hypothetical protein